MGGRTGKQVTTGGAAWRGRGRMEEVEAGCGSEALGLMERLYATATGAGLALGGGGAAVDGARLEPGLSCRQDWDAWATAWGSACSADMRSIRCLTRPHLPGGTVRPVPADESAGKAFNSAVEAHLHPGPSRALQRPTLEFAVIRADTLSRLRVQLVALKFSLFEPSESLAAGLGNPHRTGFGQG